MSTQDTVPIARGTTRRTVLKAGLAAAALAPMSPALGEPSLKPVADYHVQWPADRLDALREQIRSFRFPRLIPGAGWDYGMDPEYLRALISHWAYGFDMEGAASVLNRFPQYMTRVEDLDIHFIRVIGEGGPNKARLPLLLTHGWPGSIYEFWEVIEPWPSRPASAPGRRPHSI